MKALDSLGKVARPHQRLAADREFNWRLILAPDFVFRYLVAHEVAHLAIPDHSAKFWLTVQSLCPEVEQAKQWLSRHHAQLTVKLESVVGPEASNVG